MNNFFLRPWATGPVFGADEEGGGGGGDEETAVDPFARSARTQDRIQTGRLARTGSTPPGEVQRFPSYTGFIPRQSPTNINADTTVGESGPLQSSGVAFDGVISGNDDPDNVFAQSFVPPSDILSSLSDEFQGGTDTSGMPGILTSMGNMIVSPAGGATPSRPNLDGINPQGPTYTPPPVSTDRSFLENVGDAFSGVGNTVYDFINPLSPTGTVGGDVSTGLGELNRAAKTGIRAAYSGADLLEDTYGNVIESITGKRPAGITQFYADERARETGMGSGLIPTPERRGGPQYFDAFGTPVGSAEGIRRADKLREDAALRAGRTAQVQRDKQANIDLVAELGGDNVSAVDRGMYQLGTLIPEVGSAAVDFLGRPVDQGGSLLPSSTSQNLTQAGIDKKIAGDVVFNNLDAETQRALTSDLSVRDPNALYQQVMQAAPSAIASLIPATGGLTKTAAGTGAALFGGESAIDRDAVLDQAYSDGSLQKSPAYQMIARDYGGNNDLALAAAKKSANVDNIVSDVLSGAAIGAAQAKLGPGLGRQFVGEGVSEGVLEQQLMAENIDRQFDPTEEFGIGANPTIQQMINEGVVAGILGEGVSSSGAPVITAPNTSNVSSGTTENTVEQTLGTGTALTTPMNTGIASLQPESNQGPLVGEVMKDNVLRAPRKGFSGLNTAPLEDAVILTEQQLIAPPANEFAGTETLANQAIANNLANRTSPNPNDLAGTNVQQEFNFQRPPDMGAVFDPAAGLGPAFTNPAVAAQRDQQARLNALSPSGETNPLVNEIIQGRNQPVAPDMNTRNAFDPVGGQGPAAFGRSSFADIGPSGTSNPLVSEILAARNIPTAPGPEVNLDPASGLGPAFTDPAVIIARQAQAARDAAAQEASTGDAQQRAVFPDLAPSGETNPLVGEILAGRNVPLAPDQDASFTPEDTAITPVSNVLPSNRQGPNFNPPGAPQRGPDVDPTLLQKQSEIQALIEQGILNEEQAARMMAINTPRSTGDVTPANEFVGATQAEMNLNVPNNAASTMDTMAVMDLINNEIAISGELSMETARRIENSTPFSMVEIANFAEQSMGLTPSRTSGESRSVVSAPNILPMERAENQTGVAPFVFEGEVMNDNVLRAPRPGFKGLNNTPLEDAVLADEIITPEGPNLPRKGFNNQVLEDAEIISPTITSTSGTATGTSTSGTNVTVDTSGNVTTDPVETTNINPYIDTTVFPPYDDTGGDVVVPPVGSGGDDDDTTVPPDDGGNCPPGYELRLINGMYVCVPIDQVEDEVEEEEETPAVTYGRPGIGVYYDPVTVGPISPYILNSDEVV